MKCLKKYAASNFQFTRPQGARPDTVDRIAKAYAFQFTRPQGARHWLGLRFVVKMLSFNSRARRGRDQVAIPSGPYNDVSIHAPAGGATGLVSDAYSVVRFQFTRPQGARPVCLVLRSRRLSFNSRARRGRDPVVPDESIGDKVSIHAPAGGATSGVFQCTAHWRVSIHAPAGGATSA